ncbi:hypothetical protein [Ulvibacter litoralis]|uniref:Uncharacterized protein n=1 Tax=Ulvibacter litoralis TaxID=227084 RepID=A0A1G7F255_9FLAO|nr:hypothetical protein [Ulvibacter litoralis]GHC52968.1 hypothetical protein GCM10008083_16160 [Ulvibacter litoralis]SDE69977.1 hypothetical protein SAMN05421855_102283 [Ulvibacter litoralis]
MKNTKNIHGFKTPEGYFDSFEDDLFAKIASDELPKKTGFKTPEGYFDSLEEDIMAKVVVSEVKEETLVKEPKVLPLFRKQTLAYVAAIAACFILVFSLVNQKESVSDQVNKLQFAAVDTYIDDGNLAIDSYDVVSLLTDDDIDNLSYEDELFSEENLKEYLLDHINEETLLIQ